MIGRVNHGLLKTPDLILTFFILQYILYALVNVNIFKKKIYEYVVVVVIVFIYTQRLI